MFLKILQNSQDSPSARVSFLIKMQACQSLYCNKVRSATVLKKGIWHRCFSVNFAKFLRTSFSQNTSGPLLLLLSMCNLKKYLWDLLKGPPCHNEIKIMKSVHNLDLKYSTAFINRKSFAKRYEKLHRHHESL